MKYYGFLVVAGLVVNGCSSLGNETPWQNRHHAIDASAEVAASKLQQAATREVLEVTNVLMEALTQDEITRTILAWTAAWSRQEVDAYLSFYSDRFLVEDAFPSLQFWREQRRRAIRRPHAIRVMLTDVEIKIADENNAQVSCIQHYWSNLYQDETEKIITLQKERDTWKIVKERAL